MSNELKGVKEKDPEWIKEIAEGLLDMNISSFSDNQKKMLKNIYFENLNDGLKPREAIEKALQVVLCFKQ